MAEDKRGSTIGNSGVVGRVLTPAEIVEIDGPVIFLAGPIQGAGWQPEAIAQIQHTAPALHIASPRRDYLPEEFDYGRQVDWETHFLRRAASNGAVLFWLAKEVTHNCERAFAQTTRFELGEWKVRYERDHIRLIIGIEAGFTNGRYIRRRLSQDCPEINICTTLAETCQQAIDQIYR